MRVMTDLEITKAAMLKAKRTEIRLRYALMADAEIARELPELEDRINDAISKGKPLEIVVGFNA